MTAPPPESDLRARPWRYGFDAAVRVLTRDKVDPAEALRFRTQSGLAYPPSDVTSVEQTDAGSPRVTATVIGLTGPSGVLPRMYSETVTQTLRGRSRALHDFLDMLGHRLAAFFARARVKYHPVRAAAASSENPVSRAMLAFTGYATPHLTPRLLFGVDPLLHYAGLFAMRPRSADRLAALASDWLGMRVEVMEFAGAWLPLPPDQRTRMPTGPLAGAFCRLAVDAAIGVRSWDPQARIILRIGPLDRNGFAALMPDRLGLHRLVALVRAYLGYELAFAINPVLAAAQVPPFRFDAQADPPPRLGWNSWIPGPPGSQKRQTDAADAVFEAAIIEAQQPR